MTDPEDKTGRHGGWANKISITTLIVIVFGAGGAWVEAKLTRKALERSLTELAETFKDSAKEQKAFNTNIDARQTADEIWRAAYEAANKERNGGKRR